MDSLFSLSYRLRSVECESMLYPSSAAVLCMSVER